MIGTIYSSHKSTETSDQVNKVMITNSQAEYRTCLLYLSISTKIVPTKKKCTNCYMYQLDTNNSDKRRGFELMGFGIKSIGYAIIIYHSKST